LISFLWGLVLASFNFILAMNNLGDCLQNGSGCLKNQKMAVEFHKKAADLGNPYGKINDSIIIFPILYLIENF